MKKIKVGNAELNVVVSKTKSDQEKGLMYLKGLKCNHGMLFQYPVEKSLTFWMKNTQIPLSIAFINKNGEINEIQTLEPLSEKKVTCEKPSMYALEVNKGWFDKNNIKVGDKISGLEDGGVKIKIIKLPPQAKQLAKTIEDKLVAMTMMALKSKISTDSDLEKLNIDVQVKESNQKQLFVQ